MDSYKVSLVPSAHKELRRLPNQEIPRVHARIVALATHPCPVSSKKVSGSEDVYRVRQGDYRIVYHVNDAAREITVLRIRHRKEAYR